MSFYLIAILAFRVKEMSWGISGWVKLVTIFWGTQGFGEGYARI